MALASTFCLSCRTVYISHLLQQEIISTFKSPCQDIILIDCKLNGTRIVIGSISRLSPREFGQSSAPFSGLVRPAVYSPGVLAWDGKGLLKLICVYYGIREKLSS